MRYFEPATQEGRGPTTTSMMEEADDLSVQAYDLLLDDRTKC